MTTEETKVTDGEVKTEEASADELFESLQAKGAELEPDEDTTPQVDEPVTPESDDAPVEDDATPESEDEPVEDEETPAEDGEKTPEVEAKAEDEVAEGETPAEDEPEKSDKDKKHDEAFAKMRLEKKELADRLDKLEAERANPPEVQKTVEGVFSDYMKASTEDNTAAMLANEKIIGEQMTAPMLVDVINKARDGKFGENSQDVGEIATKYLPVATARQQQAEQQQVAIQQKFNQDLSKVGKEFPDLLVADSSHNKFMKKWDLKMLGLDNTGKKVQESKLSDDEVRYIADNPLVHARLMNDSYEVAISHTEKLTKENKELKDKLNLSESPEKSSAPVNNDKENKPETADDMLKKLKRKSLELAT